MRRAARGPAWWPGRPLREAPPGSVRRRWWPVGPRTGGLQGGSPTRGKQHSSDTAPTGQHRGAAAAEARWAGHRGRRTADDGAGAPRRADELDVEAEPDVHERAAGEDGDQDGDRPACPGRPVAPSPHTGRTGSRPRHRTRQHLHDRSTRHHDATPRTTAPKPHPGTSTSAARRPSPEASRARPDSHPATGRRQGPRPTPPTADSLADTDDQEHQRPKRPKRTHRRDGPARRRPARPRGQPNRKPTRKTGRQTRPEPGKHPQRIPPIETRPGSPEKHSQNTAGITTPSKHPEPAWHAHGEHAQQQKPGPAHTPTTNSRWSDLWSRQILPAVKLARF